MASRVGGFNRGIAKERLDHLVIHLNDRLGVAASADKSPEKSAMRVKATKLRSEIEYGVCGALAPYGKSRHLEEALCLLAGARNLETYCIYGEAS